MNWLDGTLVGFDTETTGVNTREDRIVTAAVMTRGAAGHVERTWLINPGIEIPERATAVHGITTERARAEGAAPQVALDEIATALTDALAQGTPVVAFNASYDLSIIEVELRRHGLRTLTDRLGQAGVRPIIDPLVLDRHLDKWRKGKRTLADMCREYAVDVDANGLHAADADVDATLDLLVAMSRRYPSVREVAPDALHDLQIDAHRRWAESFRAYLVSRGQTDDLPDTRWPLSR